MSGMELMRVAVCLGAILLVCVVMLMLYRHWWECRSAIAYERHMQEMRGLSTIVVADTTYEELSSCGLRECGFCTMTLFDSRLGLYWAITVPPERLHEVKERLCIHEVRILDRTIDEAAACCLRDKLFWDEHCRVCGGRREKGEGYWCQECRVLLEGNTEGKQRGNGW